MPPKRGGSSGRGRSGGQGRGGKKSNRRGQQRDNNLGGVSLQQAEGITRKMEQQKKAQYNQFKKMYAQEKRAAADVRTQNYRTMSQFGQVIGNIHKEIERSGNIMGNVMSVETGLEYHNGTATTHAILKLYFKFAGVKADTLGHGITYFRPRAIHNCDHVCTGKAANKALAAIRSDVNDDKSLEHFVELLDSAIQDKATDALVEIQHLKVTEDQTNSDTNETT